MSQPSPPPAHEMRAPHGSVEQSEARMTTFTFDGQQLSHAIEILRAIAATFPTDSPEAVILLAATGIAATRAVAVLEAQLQEVRA